jgi:tetratricopeptide (TPR) repeat protein
MPGGNWFILIVIALAVVFFGTRIAKALSSTISKQKSSMDPLNSTDLKIGQKLEMEGKYDKAAMAYRQLIAAYPKAEIGYLFLGYLKRKAGDHAAAAEAFRGALSVSPESVEAMEELALSLKATGDLSGAVELFRKVIAAEPGNASVHGELGLALLALGDRGGALGELEAYERLSGDNPRGRARAVREEAIKALRELRAKP